MARTFGAADQLLATNNILGSATYLFPMTMACWFRAVTLSDSNIFCIGSFATANNWFTLNTTPVANQLAFDCQGGSGGSDVTAVCNATIQANQWVHVAGVRSSATSAIAYVNGVAGTTASGTALAPVGLDQCTIGGGIPSGGAYTGHGPAGITVAQCGIWTSALSGANIASLATMGTEVDSVASGSLVGCWKLKFPGASPETDSSSGGHTMAVTGAVTTLDPWWDPDANAGQHAGERPIVIPRRHILPAH